MSFDLIEFAPPPVTNMLPVDDGPGGGSPRSWWEDTNKNGVPDAYFTDQDGDGKIDVGDTVHWEEDAFIYEQTVNEYTAQVFKQGAQDWAAGLGWDIGIGVGASFGGIDTPGRGGFIVAFVAATHEFMADTFGMIDFGVMSHIATDAYSEWFGTYNPYEDNS